MFLPGWLVAFVLFLWYRHDMSVAKANREETAARDAKQRADELSAMCQLVAEVRYTHALTHHCFSPRMMTYSTTSFEGTEVEYLVARRGDDEWFISFRSIPISDDLRPHLPPKLRALAETRYWEPLAKDLVPLFSSALRTVSDFAKLFPVAMRASKETPWAAPVHGQADELDGWMRWRREMGFV